MTAPDGVSIEREIGAAIGDILIRHEQSVTTRWVALVETITPEGRRGLWTFTSEGATAWDTLGMLTYAIQAEQAATSADRE